MTGSISAIGNMGMSTSFLGVTSSAQKLTDATKKQLESLGIDTTKIKTEAQGQTALQQAQSTQSSQSSSQTQHAQNGTHQHTGGNAEIQALKTQATELAAKLGVTVQPDEKLSEILAAIQPALDAKLSASGNDQSKLAEVQSLQAEFNTISSSLSSIQAQQPQKSEGSQGSQAISNSLSSMAVMNMVYHGLS